MNSKRKPQRGKAADEVTDTHAEAHKLHRMGLPITLCPAGTKKPLGEGWTAEYPGKAWQKKRWSLKEIDRAFKAYGDLNVGVLFGPVSKLIDIEQDSPEDRAAFAELFDGCPPPVTASFSSRRGPHHLFAWHPDLEQIGKAVVHFHGLEIRIGAGGKGAHSAFPPSTTGGVARVWLNPLDECPAAPLPQLALERIIQAGMAAASVEVPVAGSMLSSSGGNNREYRDTEIASVSLLSLSLCNPQLEAIAQAIRLTRPSSKGHRHRCLFRFARHLKAIPSLANAEAATLRPIVRQWFEAALPNIGTKEFDETWADFCTAWENVKFPAGQEPIHQIYKQAIAKPLPQAAELYETASLRNLVGLCNELQQVAGPEPFYLGCRTAGEVLGINHVLANKWLRQLERDNVLEVTKRGTQNRVSRYRYLKD
jgi:hypothetical protein